MDNIITCHFMGGLGNQLFEASHALSQGWKHNRPTVFFPHSSTPLQGNSTENYVNNIFRKLTFVQSIENLIGVQEKTFHYSEVYPSEGNTQFHGYFQSTKNWFGYHDKIREMFSPSEDVKENLHKKYPQLYEPNTLSLHVRRSDYLKSPDIHPTIGVDYLEYAIKMIEKYSVVFIFSDDQEWVKSNLDLKDTIYVSENEDYLELWLMSLCSNHIISNSTFSWWGSFLNSNPNKKVIAPSIWFGPNGPNGKDIYEKNWTLIEVEYKQGILNLKNDYGKN